MLMIFIINTQIFKCPIDKHEIDKHERTKEYMNVNHKYETRVEEN